jgi:hypothetical protein
MIADVIRYVALCEIAASVGFLAGTMWQVQRWHVDPWHVIGMGFSYILFAGAGMIELSIRLGHPATWRTIYMFNAGTVALVVQIYTYRYWHSGKRWARGVRE